MEPAVNDATTTVEDKDDEIMLPKTKRSCLLLIFSAIILHVLVQPVAHVFLGLLFLSSSLSRSSFNACGSLRYILHSYMPDVIKRSLPMLSPYKCQNCACQVSVIATKVAYHVFILVLGVGLPLLRGQLGRKKNKGGNWFVVSTGAV
jgi:hypothetical protein